jgi:hypothetical protein
MTFFVEKLLEGDIKVPMLELEAASLEDLRVDKVL